QRVPAGNDLITLWILERNIRAVRPEEVAVITFPCHIAFRIAPGSDDIRPPIRIERIASYRARTRGDRIQAPGVTVRQIQDEARLPVFDRSGQPSMATREEKLVRSDRQLHESVRPQFLSDAAGRFAVIQLRVQWIRITASGQLHRFAEAVG